LRSNILPELKRVGGPFFSRDVGGSPLNCVPGLTYGPCAESAVCFDLGFVHTFIYDSAYIQCLISCQHKFKIKFKILTFLELIMLTNFAESGPVLKARPM
jgi:hypothetical protein